MKKIFAMSTRSGFVGGSLAGLLALFFGVALWPSQSSAGSEPEPSPSASASAEASASAASSASGPGADAGPPPLPRFDAEPFGEEKTPRPTPADWKPTTPVMLSEPLPFDCNAYRVREWIKIRCSKLQTAELTCIGGSREGVSLFVDPPLKDFPVSPGGEIVFPVRRGDRRVFEWSRFGESYEGVGFPELAFLISESWAPDEPSPVIIPHTL